MRNYKLKYILAAILGLAAAACNTDGCLDNQSSLPKAGLFSSATGNAITLSNIEISGVGAPGDSVLGHSRHCRERGLLAYEVDKAVYGMALPL